MDDALLSISPVDRGLLVKMLITLEPRGIFRSNAYLIIISYIVQPLVWKTVMRVRQVEAF